MKNQRGNTEVTVTVSYCKKPLPLQTRISSSVCIAFLSYVWSPSPMSGLCSPEELELRTIHVGGMGTTQQVLGVQEHRRAGKTSQVVHIPVLLGVNHSG